MDKRKDPSSVDIKKVLLEMRRFRMGLIQTADQLRFSYLAVIEGAKFIMGDSSVQVSIASAFIDFPFLSLKKEAVRCKNSNTVIFKCMSRDPRSHHLCSLKGDRFPDRADRHKH